MQTQQSGLERFLSRLAEPVLMLDLKSRTIAFANSCAEEMFGFSTKELAGVPIDRLCPDAVEWICEDSATDGQNRIFDVLHRDRTSFSAECHLDLLEQSPSISPQALALLHLRPVTSEHNSVDAHLNRTASQGAQREEIRLQALTGARDEILLEMDEEGKCLQLWAENETLLIRPAEQILGRRAEDFLPANVSAPLLQSIARVLKTGRPENREFPLDLSLGSRWFQARISPLSSPSSSPRSVSILARDITLRKRVEADLHASEMRFQEMLENLRMAAILLDGSGHLLYGNDFFFQLSGYSREAVVGRNWLDLLTTENDRKWMKESWQAFMRNQEVPRHLENEIMLHSGETRWMSWNFTLFRPRQGDAPGCICLGEDITERHRAMELLEKNNEIKTEFISTAAHELRTPLTTIMGFSELLLDAQSDTLKIPERKEFLCEIHSKAEHLSRIIDDLLDLSRIDTGQSLPLRWENTDLNLLLKEVTISFQRRHPDYSLELDLPEIPSFSMLADRGRMEQVMENLVGNAVKFSKPGSSIRIYGGPNGENYRIAVRDNGCGMTLDQRQRIFEKFYRADASNTSTPGLGLGMSIVHQIIKAHGGHIQVQSQPEKGTTVLVDLPITHQG